MAEQEINIRIAGRNYTMYILPEQEEIMRKIGKDFERAMKDIENSYAYKDKQDVLAMAALMQIAKAEFKLKKIAQENINAEKNINEIINILDLLEDNNE